MIEIVGGERGLGRPGITRALRRVAAEVGLGGGVTIKLTGADEARALNRRFRGRRYLPDVLSFPAGEAVSPGRGYAGDVLICLPKAEAQARAAGHSLRREIFLLAVHGLLHLAGYDHERDSGAMLELQARLVASRGTEIQ